MAEPRVAREAETVAQGLAADGPLIPGLLIVLAAVVVLLREDVLEPVLYDVAVGTVAVRVARALKSEQRKAGVGQGEIGDVRWRGTGGLGGSASSPFV